uniref:Sushi domain-containing protein n=1 Tax=Terrapene triunguis TaxID=2587831 RepID=A0A674IZM3_9SAUR
AISCGNIENGSVKPRFFFQRRKRTFECNAGYIAENDNNSIECTSSGWSPVPRCIPIQCGRIENGKIVDKVEEKTTFQCNHGYKSENGINETTCTSEGWSPVPICIGTGEKCGRPPTIKNGDITTLSLKEYVFGSSVEYKCQHYYIIQGERKSYCYNGNWTKPPVCLEPCVITQEDMRSHNIDLKWASAQKLYVSHGAFVEFKCRSSLSPNSSNNHRVQCNAGQIPYPQCT